MAAHDARAEDKAQAIRDILTIQDFEAFVARSGIAGILGGRD